MIIIHNNWKIFNNNLYITFIDVGQGDSILIELPHNKSNILIDTGGRLTYQIEDWEKTNTNFSIAENTIIPLLKSKGILKIDHLILTHGDEDHMGEAYNLINNYTVDNIYINSGSLNNLEKKVLDKRGDTKLLSEGDNITIGDFILNIINPKGDINENENSVVIYIEIYKIKILFTGDIGKSSEKNIMDKYNLNNIDILKIAHHGSKYSSDLKFLEYTKPRYSIISVGENNRFSHPSDIVINNLKKIKSNILQTSKLGSIEFIINKNKVSKKYYIP